MNRLFAFGLGFSALTLAKRLSAEGWQIAGTARDEGKIERLKREGYDVVRFAGEPGNEALPKHLAGTTHLLHSIPPGPERRSGARVVSRRDRGAPFARMDRLSLDRRGLWRPGGRLGR